MLPILRTLSERVRSVSLHRSPSWLAARIFGKYFGQTEPGHLQDISNSIVLGYDFNNGGISNQKMALIGLFYAAHQQAKDYGRVSIFLPMITNYDQRKEKTFQVPLDMVFDLSKILKFARKSGIQIIDKPDTIQFSQDSEKFGWEYFGRGAGAQCSLFDRPNEFRDDAAVRFLKSLQPLILKSKEFKNIRKRIFRKLKIQTVVQLRIEEDWYHYARGLASLPGEPKEDLYLPAEAIVKKVKLAGLAKSGKVYVCCDEKYIFAPKDEIKQKILQTTGVDTIWKTDILPLNLLGEMSFLHSSLIDYEMAIAARYFVGNSRSSFANLATFERQCRRYSKNIKDYIYNDPREYAVERTDYGTQIWAEHATRRPSGFMRVT